MRHAGESESKLKKPTEVGAAAHMHVGILCVRCSTEVFTCDEFSWTGAVLSTDCSCVCQHVWPAQQMQSKLGRCWPEQGGGPTCNRGDG